MSYFSMIPLIAGRINCNNQLSEKGIEVLFDDREVSAGEKFADSDLIGIPYRVVISKKSLVAGGVEVKKRNETEGSVITVEELMEYLDK